MENNGLKLLQIKSNNEKIDLSKSKFETFVELESFISKVFGADGNVIGYLDYKVLIGTMSHAKIKFFEDETFDPKFIKVLRIFNNVKELHIWKTKTGLNARLRADGEGKEISAVDANQILLGSDIQELSDASYIKLIEKRGTEIILQNNNFVVDKNNRIAIKSRNYIKNNEFGQASYFDCRFLEFCQVSKDQSAMYLGGKNGK